MMLATCISSFAQNETSARSRRSSICSILIKHDNQKYADEIERQFSEIPVSERFNDHNLSVRTVNAHTKKLEQADLDKFVDDNGIASRLVGKWFDRNVLTGECSMDTIKSRGVYDASLFDVEIARRSPRGLAMLQDAGEDLIGNTYLLLNDVNYIDKSKRSAIWAAIGSATVGVLMAMGGASSSQISSTMNNTAAIIQSYKGFSVKIRTCLYRLEWDDETSARFYSEAYTQVPDEQKKATFEAMRPTFKLRYMGEVTSKGGSTSFLGINENQPEMMIRKACARAIDENIADLQHKVEPFRIKSPVLSVEPEITVPIGIKEGVTPDSKFEVLMPEEADGKIKYKRVGTVRPIASKIWDNRFMSDAEGAINAELGSTSFVKTSGGDFAPGMLIREID